MPAHLFNTWKLLNPSYCIDGAPPLDDAPPGRKFGYTLERVLDCSAALMSDDTEALNTLVYMSNVTGIDKTLPVAEQLAQIHDIVAPHLPEMVQTPALEKTPFVFPHLLSIYDELTTAIFVVPDDTQVIRETDWSAVAEWFGQQFERLLVTTESHFKLLSQDVLSVSLTTGNVRHNWGQSLVSDEMITPSALVGRALHSVLDIYTDVLPNAYIMAGECDQAVRKVAHDIMNDLLRITFRHEVLSFDLPETEHTAPEPFSDSKNYESQSDRVLQIYDYVGNWVTFYSNLYAELQWDNVAE